MSAGSPFRKVCVVGVGLLGGSVALALRRNFPQVRVVGVDRGNVAQEARQAGLLHEAAGTLEEGVHGADLVLLATPVRTTEALLPELAGSAQPEVLVTDVGGTKRTICAAGASLPAFIGGHPMAGTAQGGWQHATAELFRGAPWVLCPVGAGGRAGMGALELLVEGLGARPLSMEPEAHDRTMARLSHLPQLLAMALMETGATEELRAAGPAFREMTRLAASPSGPWEDILLTNADEVRAAAELWDSTFRRLLDRCLSGDTKDAFRRVNEMRQRLDA